MLIVETGPRGSGPTGGADASTGTALTDVDDDISSGRRGGLRSGTKRPKGRTYEQLYDEAQHLGVEGRSKMDKAALQRAVDRRKR